MLAIVLNQTKKHHFRLYSTKVKLFTKLKNLTDQCNIKCEIQNSPMNCIKFVC